MKMDGDGDNNTVVTIVTLEGDSNINDVSIDMIAMYMSADIRNRERTYHTTHSTKTAIHGNGNTKKQLITQDMLHTPFKTHTLAMRAVSASTLIPTPTHSSQHPHTSVGPVFDGNAHSPRPDCMVVLVFWGRKT